MRIKTIIVVLLIELVVESQLFEFKNRDQQFSLNKNTKDYQELNSKYQMSSEISVLQHCVSKQLGVADASNLIEGDHTFPTWGKQLEGSRIYYDRSQLQNNKVNVSVIFTPTSWLTLLTLENFSQLNISKCTIKYAINDNHHDMLEDDIFVVGELEEYHPNLMFVVEATSSVLKKEQLVLKYVNDLLPFISSHISNSSFNVKLRDQSNKHGGEDVNGDVSLQFKHDHHHHQYSISENDLFVISKQGGSSSPLEYFVFHKLLSPHQQNNHHSFGDEFDSSQIMKKRGQILNNDFEFPQWVKGELVARIKLQEKNLRSNQHHNVWREIVNSLRDNDLFSSFPSVLPLLRQREYEEIESGFEAEVFELRGNTLYPHLFQLYNSSFRPLHHHFIDKNEYDSEFHSSPLYEDVIHGVDAYVGQFLGKCANYSSPLISRLKKQQLTSKSSSPSSSSSSSSASSKIEELTLSLVNRNVDMMRKLWYRSISDIITLIEPRVPRGTFLDWRFIVNVFSTLSVTINCKLSANDDENVFSYSNLDFSSSDFYFQYEIEKIPTPSFTHDFFSSSQIKELGRVKIKDVIWDNVEKIDVLPVAADFYYYFLEKLGMQQSEDEFFLQYHTFRHNFQQHYSHPISDEMKIFYRLCLLVEYVIQYPSVNMVEMIPEFLTKKKVPIVREELSEIYNRNFREIQTLFEEENFLEIAVKFNTAIAYFNFKPHLFDDEKFFREVLKRSVIIKK